MIWVYLFLVILIIRPQDWQGSIFYATPIYTIVVLCGLIFAFLKRDPQKKINLPVNYFIAIWVALTLLSNIANGNIEFGVNIFIIFLKSYCVYFMLLLLLDTPQKIRNVLLFSSLLAVILTFQGMYQNVHMIGWANQSMNGVPVQSKQELINQFIGSDYRVFWVGTWDGPNVLALIFLFSIPLWLDNLFKSERNLLFRIIDATFLYLLIFGILLTKSRGALLTFLFMLAVFIFLRFNKKIAVIGLVILPLLFSLFSSGRLAEMDSSEASAHERTWLWEQGLKFAEENPILGIGKGKFSSETGLIAHNNFVSSLAEMGFTGLFIYVSIGYLSLMCCFITMKKLKSIGRRDELFYMSRVVFILTSAFYAATFFVIMEGDMLFVIWALCACIYIIARNEIMDMPNILSKQSWLHIALSSFFIAAMIWLIAEKEII